MVRVVLRHVNDTEGRLLGDFPPSEIRPLMELLDSTPIYAGDDPCVVSPGAPSQFVSHGGPGAPRFVLEVLVEDSGE